MRPFCCRILVSETVVDNYAKNLVITRCCFAKVELHLGLFYLLFSDVLLKKGLMSSTIALRLSLRFGSVPYYQCSLAAFCLVETKKALFSFSEKRFSLLPFDGPSASAIFPKRALVLASAGTLVMKLSHKIQVKSSIEH